MRWSFSISLTLALRSQLFRPQGDQKPVGSLLQEICLLNLGLLGELKCLGFWWSNLREMRNRQHDSEVAPGGWGLPLYPQKNTPGTLWAGFSQIWAGPTVGNTFCLATQGVHMRSNGTLITLSTWEAYDPFYNLLFNLKMCWLDLLNWFHNPRVAYEPQGQAKLLVWVSWTRAPSQGDTGGWTSTSLTKGAPRLGEGRGAFYHMHMDGPHLVPLVIYE